MNDDFLGRLCCHYQLYAVSILVQSTDAIDDDHMREPYHVAMAAIDTAMAEEVAHHRPYTCKQAPLACLTRLAPGNAGTLTIMSINAIELRLLPRSMSTISAAVATYPAAPWSGGERWSG